MVKQRWSDYLDDDDDIWQRRNLFRVADDDGVTVITDEPGNRKEERQALTSCNRSSQLPKNDGVIMLCRSCGKKGDHWTIRCPNHKVHTPDASESHELPTSASGKSKSVRHRMSKSHKLLAAIRTLFCFAVVNGALNETNWNFHFW